MSELYVTSNFPRIADDNYQTVDHRCSQALAETMKINATYNVIDSCSPQGSGILDYFNSIGVQASPCSDAYSKDYYCDWDVFNPPYERSKVDHIIKARIRNLVEGKTRVGVACLLRTQFDHAKTRQDMFKNNQYYEGQIKMLFRPIWFPDGESTPIHNYVWHIWSKGAESCKKVWYW